MKQGKIWGLTQEILRTRTVSAHHISAQAGGFCSEHRHEFKSNIFYVISGRLLITIWREVDGPHGPQEIPDQTEIAAGELTAVPAGAWHKFEALENTEAIEFYTVALQDPDIERRSTGGILGRISG